MQIKEIEELIQLIERSQIEEFELERAGTRIRVKKATSAAPPVATAPATTREADSAVEPAEGVNLQSETGVGEKAERLHVFTAPNRGNVFSHTQTGRRPAGRARQSRPDRAGDLHH